MKKLIILLGLLLFNISIFSQITAPAGLTFGSNTNSVKDIINGKGGIIINDETDFLVFSDVQLGSKNIELSIFQFVDNKLHTVKFLFISELTAKTQSLYNDLQKMLTNKYGNPDTDLRHFTGVYDDGDGYEMQAIRLGEGTIVSVWEGEKNSIVLDISYLSGDMYATIIYQNTELLNVAISKQKEENSSEF